MQPHRKRYFPGKQMVAVQYSLPLVTCPIIDHCIPAISSYYCVIVPHWWSILTQLVVMQRDAHCWRQLDTPNSAYFFRSRRRKQRRLCKMINWGRRQHWRDLSKNETCVERIYRCLIFPWLHTLASVWSHQNKQTRALTVPMIQPCRFLWQTMI